MCLVGMISFHDKQPGGVCSFPFVQATEGTKNYPLCIRHRARYWLLFCYSTWLAIRLKNEGMPGWLHKKTDDFRCRILVVANVLNAKRPEVCPGLTS